MSDENCGQLRSHTVKCVGRLSYHLTSCTLAGWRISGMKKKNDEVPVRPEGHFAQR